MDLVATLRGKIELLDEGDHLRGLEAVLLHIQTAIRHHARGKEQSDETAFTDAIYRTNQAFEGSVKEAYRVLEGQDPSKKTPYAIEKYLEEKNVFRDRVLKQLTNYRTEWRNPSTHDYKLDFDESEAFLAIVSVTAFAVLLLDQVAEKLAFDKSKAETQSQKKGRRTARSKDLYELLIKLLTEYANYHLEPKKASTSFKLLESQFIGSLHGFLSSAAPRLKVEVEPLLEGNTRLRPDLIVSRGKEKVIIELKRQEANRLLPNAVTQVENYMNVSGINSGILFLIPNEQGALDIEKQIDADTSNRLAIIKPA